MLMFWKWKLKKNKYLAFNIGWTTIQLYPNKLKNVPFCPVAAFIGNVTESMHWAVAEIRLYSTHDRKIIKYAYSTSLGTQFIVCS